MSKSPVTMVVRDDLDKLVSAPSQEALKRAALAGGEVIKGNAKVNINQTFSKSHGDAGLAGSIVVEVENEHPDRCSVVVGPTVVYGRIRELGGTIQPIFAKMLSWVNDAGERIFAKKVTVEPKPYLRPAADEHQEEINQAIGFQLKNAIEGNK